MAGRVRAAAWDLLALRVLRGTFCLLSLLLATIYGVYREQAGNTANGSERERAACCARRSRCAGREFVSGADAKLFVEALNNHTDIPSVSPASLPALMEIFVSEDDDDDVYLAPAEFEVLVQGSCSSSSGHPQPLVAKKRVGSGVRPVAVRAGSRAVVRAHEGAFAKFITAMLCFNAVVVVVEWNKSLFGFDASTTPVCTPWRARSGCCTWWRCSRSGAGTPSSSTGATPSSASPMASSRSSARGWRWRSSCWIFDQGVWLKWLIVMRVLRLTRLLVKVRLYKVIISTFFELIPSLFPLLCAFGCIVSVATYGVQQFGGLSYRGNPRLEGTSYAGKRMPDLNLNDYSALVMLVCQCIVNNWFVVMDGYATMTGNEF